MTIHALEIMPDHVHLFVESDPTRCVAEIVNRMKGYTSRVLRERVPLAAIQTADPLEPKLLRRQHRARFGRDDRAIHRRTEGEVGMRRAFKFRLWTNANQERELDIDAGDASSAVQRLPGVPADWPTRSTPRSIKYADCSRWFKHQRASNPYFARLNFSSAQATMRRLDKAFAAFFRRVKAGEKPGYPDSRAGITSTRSSSPPTVTASA